MPSSALSGYRSRLDGANLLPVTGQVVSTVGLLVESVGPPAGVGDICRLCRRDGGPPLFVEVVGFRNGHLLTIPLGSTAQISAGDRLVKQPALLTAPAGPQLLGRVLDGLGRPIDGRGPLGAVDTCPLHRPPLNPMVREPIATPIGTGVRAIDALLTAGRGQRLGVFGGSGVGKSTLLGMMARNTAADIAVIGLVGERGREVRSFIEHDLGEAGLARSVVVASTSDNPPLVRLRAGLLATAIAEYFRDLGQNVLLMMDSVTRFAMAQREVGLAAGEPPTTKGYPPSVFAMLPNLLERAGSLRGSGSITGIYTVLVEGDDTNEPIADAVRAILDGHIVLSRDLAARNHYPAIDILQSISRTMPDVTAADHRLKAAEVRHWMATLRDSEDLVSVGAYVKGSSPKIDAALERRDGIEHFLTQAIEDATSLDQSIASLMSL